MSDYIDLALAFGFVLGVAVLFCLAVLVLAVIAFSIPFRDSNLLQHVVDRLGLSPDQL